MKLPAVAVGCMGLSAVSDAEAERFVAAAADAGLNFFDHADIYGKGECERAFGRAFKSLKIPRDAIFLQSKCGIVPGVMFDFSEKHIVESVEGSLKRLCTDHLDMLLLHRPDALAEPDEVAAAFDKLEREGKVLQFGVSNMHPYQIELLKTRVKQRICADQLQLSPAHAGMISCGTEANMITEGAVSRDGYILDYCRMKGIAVQAWSPFRYGFFEGVYLNNPQYAKLNAALEEIGAKHGISKAAAVVAWILRIPAQMQVITGTTKAERLLDAAAGANATLSREEWYKIYIEAGHILP